MRKSTCTLALALGLQMALFWGCDPGDEVTATTGSTEPNTCEGCHIDETSLMKYASESSAVAGGGG